jgi:hypothetical protein
MKEVFNNYLNPIQYNKICKYWRFINEISYKLENFDYSKYESYQEYSDDEETISRCIERNNKLDRCLEKLKEKLNYYQQEYEKYINSIGFELGNRTYDEILFNLLNDGIILD